MMLKRIAILSAVALGFMAAPAAADDDHTQYPPTDDEEITVSATALCPGDSLVVQGRGFAADSSVLIALAANDTNLGTATADGEGNVSFETAVPDTQAAGDYTIQASGTDPEGAELVLSAALTVEDCDEMPADEEPTAAAPSDDDESSGGLPVTGSSTMTLVQIGVALAAVGGILLALARRRRAAHLRTA